MPPAIIGGAIAAAGTIGGAVLANKGASKAAGATRDAAEQSAAVQRDIYGQNQQMLSPYVQTGNAAMGNINALLGLAPQAAPAAAMGSMGGGMGGGNQWGGYLSANPDVLQDYNANVNKRQFPTAEAYAQWHYQNYGQNEGRQLPTQAIGAPGTTAPAVSQPTAQQAFDTFRNSTGYQFRLGQGLDAVNSGYAGAGTIKSGAAMKGINDYASGMASQEFGNYLNSLGNQQAVGLSAGSALAGVGQNYANSLGNIYQAKGDNLANASLLKAQNTGQAFNSLAQIGGKIAGGY